MGKDIYAEQNKFSPCEYKNDPIFVGPSARKKNSTQFFVTEICPVLSAFLVVLRQFPFVLEICPEGQLRKR